MKMHVQGIFAYTINEAGLITTLRGYWSLEDSKIEQPSA